MRRCAPRKSRFRESCGIQAETAGDLLGQSAGGDPVVQIDDEWREWIEDELERLAVDELEELARLLCLVKERPGARPMERSWRRMPPVRSDGSRCRKPWRP